jgi:O-antigen ligase
MRQGTQATADATRRYDTSGADHGWDALLVCVGGFILASVGRVHQVFPVLLPLKPALVTGALAILLCLLDRTPVRWLRGLRIPATRYLLALMAWMALSVPGALWQGGAFTTLVDFTKTTLMYVVIVGAVRSVRDVERLAWVYFLAAVIFSLVVLARFGLGEDGRFARLYYYDSNDLATLIVTALPLGLYFAFTERRRLLRLAAWGGIAALGVGFIWSGSRGGFLALLVVITYFLLRYTTISKRLRLSAVLAIGLLTAAIASDDYWTRISTLLHPTEDYNLTDEQGRLQIWRRGLGYMIEHPVLGVGAGNFATAEGTISPLAERQQRGRGVKWGPPHNSYLQVGAELGVPGLLIFGGFLLSVFAALRAAPTAAGGGRPESPVPTRLAQSLTAALLGFAVAAFFLTLAYYDMLYMLAGMAVALRKLASLERAGSLRPPAPCEWRSMLSRPSPAGGS